MGSRRTAIVTMQYFSEMPEPERPRKKPNLAQGLTRLSGALAQPQQEWRWDQRPLAPFGGHGIGQSGIADTAVAVSPYGLPRMRAVCRASMAQSLSGCVLG
jgi:hypothetical protein